MKASELRIGNWINLGGKEWQKPGEYEICQITAMDLVNDFNFDHHGFIKPIPLTEEWLLKLGWIWNEECNSYEKYPNGDARMNLQYRDVGGSYTMFNYVLKAVICERIHYVHQLQNLYYALTGEELTIKE